MLLTNYVLSYFALRHSVIPLQNNIPEAGVRIRPEDWKLDQDLAFNIVKFKVQSIKNKHTRPQWCLKSTKEKKKAIEKERKNTDLNLDFEMVWLKEKKNKILRVQKN